MLDAGGSQNLQVTAYVLKTLSPKPQSVVAIALEKHCCSSAPPAECDPYCRSSTEGFRFRVEGLGLTHILAQNLYRSIAFARLLGT